MENNLKLNISIGSSSINLEGQSSTVIDVFNDLRLNGLGKLNNLDTSCKKNQEIEKRDETISQKNTEEVSAGIPVSVTTEPLPSLNDLVIKLDGCTEADWILIYCLYLSNSGLETFTLQDIKNKYHESNRFTPVRGKNFSTNIKKLVKSDYISSINDSEYKITSDGLKKSHALLTGEVKPKKQKKKNGKIFATKTFSVVDMDLSEEKRSEFKTHFESFKKLSNIDKAIVVACWLKMNTGKDEIDSNILFTMLKIAGSSTNYDLDASLRNAKNANKYFLNGSEKGFYKLHHIGEDHYKNKLLKEE